MTEIGFGLRSLWCQSPRSCFYIQVLPRNKWRKNDGHRERHLDVSLDVFPSFQIKGCSPLPGFLGTLSAWKDKRVRTFCPRSPGEMEVSQLSLSGLAFSSYPSTCPPFMSVLLPGGQLPAPGCCSQYSGALQPVGLLIRNHSRGNHGANIRWGRALCYLLARLPLLSGLRTKETVPAARQAVFVQGEAYPGTDAGQTGVSASRICLTTSRASAGRCCCCQATCRNITLPYCNQRPRAEGALGQAVLSLEPQAF